jgi:ketosteroid isomerase-like protein
VTIDGSGDVAYVQGTYSMMITLPGAAGPTHDEGKWVVTARKQADGSWKSTTGIWNSDLPVAAPPAPAKP